MRAASATSDGSHRGVEGIHALDIERAQVLLDHLAQREGQRRFLVVVVADNQVDGIGRAGGDLRAKRLRSHNWQRFQAITTTTRRCRDATMKRAGRQHIREQSDFVPSSIESS